VLFRIQERWKEKKSEESTQRRGFLREAKKWSFQEVLTIEQPIAA